MDPRKISQRLMTGIRGIFQTRSIRWIVPGFLLICLTAGIWQFSLDRLVHGMVILILPLALAFVAMILFRPLAGFVSLLFANYFVMGIARYIPGPLGLLVDGLLVLTWLAVLFSQLNKPVQWQKAGNMFTLLAIIWFVNALLQLLNPEAASRTAWFYSMRGVALYMFLTIPLVFILFNRPRHLDLLLKLWAWFTVLAVAKGMMQKFIGPDPWETAWLDAGGGNTHRLSQGLRIFSFFSDAATYGGSMGFSGVVFSILALQTGNRKRSIHFGIVAVLAFYGMLISGTRGSIAIPFGGFIMYALLSKKFKMILTGTFLLLGIYSFLKFSTLGASVYEIRRFREALDPDNPSLIVRMENQAKLKAYLVTRPFGGGIGSAGDWGLRFSPGTFLAETPTDSWYVQIWAEQGIVGLALHLGILVLILIKCGHIILVRLHKGELRSKALALTAGMFGIMLASYGSAAMGQMPNGIIIYVSMAMIHMMPNWQKEGTDSILSV